MPAPHKLGDRIKDSTTTTGTGNLTISGTAPTGFVAFATAIELNTYFEYCVSSTGGAEWEVGVGYLSNSTTIVRDQILTSSNSNLVVSFSAGTKDVFVTIAAKRSRSLLSQGRGYANMRGARLP